MSQQFHCLARAARVLYGVIDIALERTFGLCGTAIAIYAIPVEALLDLHTGSHLIDLIPMKFIEIMKFHVPFDVPLDVPSVLFWLQSFLVQVLLEPSPSPGRCEESF